MDATAALQHEIRQLRHDLDLWRDRAERLERGRNFWRERCKRFENFYKIAKATVQSTEPWRA